MSLLLHKCGIQFPASNKCLSLTFVFWNEQVQEKSEKWKLAKSRHQAIGADFAQPFGVHQMEEGKLNSV
jgi:hypothetical protein